MSIALSLVPPAVIRSPSAPLLQIASSCKVQFYSVPNNLQRINTKIMVTPKSSIFKGEERITIDELKIYKQEFEKLRHVIGAS